MEMVKRMMNWAACPRMAVGLMARVWVGHVLSGSLVLLCLAATASAKPVWWQGTVTHVTDGDTVWVRPLHGGTPRSVRLDGIDAPEICQRHGEAARAALASRVLGRTVQVAKRLRDNYGRELARISFEGQDVGAWLVRSGHAWSYRYRGQSGPYLAQEEQARARRLGLFRDARAEQPRAFRKRHGRCY
jgi:endonuclease YncB( thermonuclease family)